MPGLHQRPSPSANSSAHPPEHLGESLVLIGDLDYRRAELGRRFPLLPDPRGGM
jgi:hypothetical protein